LPRPDFSIFSSLAILVPSYAFSSNYLRLFLGLRGMFGLGLNALEPLHHLNIMIAVSLSIKATFYQDSSLVL